MGLTCTRPKKQPHQSHSNKYLRGEGQDNVKPLIHVTASSDHYMDGDGSLHNTAPTKSMDDYTETASALALTKLHQLMNQLENGQINSVIEMKDELSQAIAMMDIASNRDFRGSFTALSEIDDELYCNGIVSDEVREWIATTFARGQCATRRKSVMPRHTFRGVVHAVKASLYVHQILKNVSDRNRLKVPEEIQVQFEKLNHWTFDVFAFSEATDGHSLKFIGYEVLNRLDILRTFKVNDATLDRFLQAVEDGYKKNCNPYHNEMHACDVAHTVFYFLTNLGLASTLSDLEVFALLLSAIVHDLEHTGTTNGFHINSRSHLALMYNDRSVLENHHISSAFKILQDNDRNILSNLNQNQYGTFRSLLIDMVLATDMSAHFEQLRTMKVALLAGGTLDNADVLQLILHVSDISNPTKDWNIHRQWTEKIMEEFFTQGDMEMELGLDISPLCDRSVTLVPESQVGFLDVIVTPAFEVCGEVLEEFLRDNNSNVNIKEQPWSKPLTYNRRKWKEQCQSINKGSTISICSRNSTNNLHEDDASKRSPRGNRKRLTPITAS